LAPGRAKFYFSKKKKEINSFGKERVKKKKLYSAHLLQFDWYMHADFQELNSVPKKGRRVRFCCE
jgi:hypothetical protein